MGATDQKRRPLLVELRVEEMPPRLLPGLSRQFASGVCAGLVRDRFVPAPASCQSFVTPRRLAVLIGDCRAGTPARRLEVRGPAWSACLDSAGRPTAALQGFARAHGCDPAKVKPADFSGRAHAVVRRRIPARRIESALGEIIEAAAAAISAPRLMRWGVGSRRFVRPVRGLLTLHGPRRLAVSALGLKSTARTLGHRALAGRALAVPTAASYPKTLRQRHRVIASLTERVGLIERQLAKCSRPYRLVADPDLVFENAAMTENPQVYAAGFGREFLELPPEVIGSCLKRHMRCFVLQGKDGKLAARFLLVADNRPATPAVIVRGFERVVAARLADADFYWRTDLDEIGRGVHRKKLAQLAYHPRLGSMGERIERLARVADALARLGLFAAADAKIAAAAARLCKLDLATHMIGEYPQLEGCMAAHYFVPGNQGRLAALVAGHLDAGRDRNPPDRAHWPLVVATEVERAAGLIAAGERLAADRDPHGLRRCATRLAVVLAGQPGCELRALLQPLAAAAVAGEEFAAVNPDAPRVANTMVALVLERIRHQAGEILGLEKPPAAALLNAVIDPKQEKIMIGGYASRIAALDRFLASSAGAALIAANKRVANILRKSDRAGVRAGKLVEKEEIALAAAIKRAGAAIDAAFAANDYEQALEDLAALAGPVDAFFEKVMVNAPSPALRAARQALLARLSGQLNRIADLSRL